MMPKWKWLLAVVLIVVFLAGGALGMFAGAWHAHFVFIGRHSEPSGERMRRHLERQLKLTPEQMAQVGPIIDRTSAQLDVIRKETSERVAQTMRQSHEEIIPHLNPDQRERFEEMKRRHQHMMQAHDLPPPPDAP